MKKRSIFTAVLSLALVGVIAAGATLAYMTAKTDTKTNVFTAAAELKGQIKETKFDGKDFDGTAVTPQPAVLGQDQAKQMVPGMTIGKDPMVKNNTAAGGTSAWIAVKLDITNIAGGTYAEKLANLQKFATINFDTTGKWVNDTTDPSVWYYTDAVVPQANTIALFDGVTITVATDKAADIQNFNIVVNAALVQASGVGTDYLKTLDAAKSTLKGLFA